MVSPGEVASPPEHQRTVDQALDSETNSCRNYSKRSKRKHPQVGPSKPFIQMNEDKRNQICGNKPGQIDWFASKPDRMSNDRRNHQGKHGGAANPGQGGHGS